MPGICCYSLCLFLSLSLLGVPQRRHELQLRNNDYGAASRQLLLQPGYIGKVVVRVFSDDEKKGGLYFTNPMFKPVRPMLDDWAAEFAGSGTGLWAWMGSRYFSWFPDSGALDWEWRSGRRRIIPRLDLFNPEVEPVILGLFRHLAQKPVRGILIQDDLVLRRQEGFSNWGKASFTRATGMAADERLMLQEGSAANLAWQRLKCERVAQLLEKIVHTCKSVNPQLQIGMNMHYETPLAPAQARSWYAHDLQALVSSTLDYFYLMAYHRQIKHELRLSEAENRLYFQRMAAAALAHFASRLVVKLQIRDWRSGKLIPLEELQAYYRLIPPGVEAVCFAAADPEDIALIAQIIEKNRDE